MFFRDEYAKVPWVCAGSAGGLCASSPSRAGACWGFWRLHCLEWAYITQQQQLLMAGAWPRWSQPSKRQLEMTLVVVGWSQQQRNRWALCPRGLQQCSQGRAAVAMELGAAWCDADTDSIKCPLSCLLQTNPVHTLPTHTHTHTHATYTCRLMFCFLCLEALGFWDKRMLSCTVVSDSLPPRGL